MCPATSSRGFTGRMNPWVTLFYALSAAVRNELRYRRVRALADRGLEPASR